MRHQEFLVSLYVSIKSSSIEVSNNKNMNMLKTMDLKSVKKFLSSMIVLSLLCITPFSFQFCQKISLENVPRFKVDPNSCTVSEVITVSKKDFVYLHFCIKFIWF
jgi:hypothetical protein